MVEWKAAEVMRALIHHGVKGQKWGKRNGPPYPLKPEVRQRVYADKEGGSERAGYVAEGIMIVATSLAIDGAIKALHNKMERRKTAKEVAKYQQKLAEERENKTIDEKTGLPLKQDAFDPGAEEDALSVNPSIDMTGTPLTPNCTMCTAAMEMRRRGYDVTAGNTNDDDSARGGVQESEYLSWFGKSGAAKPTQISGTDGSREDYYKKVKSKMSEGGDGARGEIVVKWLDNTKHSMFYEVVNGEPVIYDTQYNVSFKGDKATQILEQTNSSSVRRLDNLQANVDKMKKSGALAW